MRRGRGGEEGRFCRTAFAAELWLRANCHSVEEINSSVAQTFMFLFSCTANGEAKNKNLWSNDM